MQKNNNFMKKVLNKEKSLKATVLSLFISITPPNKYIR